MALAPAQRFEHEERSSVFPDSARVRLRLLTPLQVPSALLTFSWDAAVLEDIKAAGAKPDTSILKPELLSAIEKL